MSAPVPEAATLLPPPAAVTMEMRQEAAARFREWRAAHPGVSQTEVAKRAGCTQAWVSQVSRAVPSIPASRWRSTWDRMQDVMNNPMPATPKQGYRSIPPADAVDEVKTWLTNNAPCNAETLAAAIGVSKPTMERFLDGQSMGKHLIHRILHGFRGVVKDASTAKRQKTAASAPPAMTDDFKQLLLGLGKTAKKINIYNNGVAVELEF